VVEADADLLWGLRGGGGNFGVVTRFSYQVHAIPVPMFAGLVLHPISRAREGLATMRDIAAVAPDGLGLNAAMISAPPAPFVPPDLHGQSVIGLAAAHVGPHDEAAELLRPLRQFAPPAADLFGAMPYTVLQSLFDGGVPHGMATYARSEWLRPLDDGGIDTLVSAAEAMTSPLSQTLLRFMGGAISRVPAGATAFRFRDAAAMVTLAAMWPEPADPGAAHTAWARDSWTALRPWSAGGGYVNHLGDEGPARVREAYGEQTWARLVALKRRYDPTNLFTFNQNVPPDATATGDRRRRAGLG
jgi:FAD/FMN-containing dehydrogenase